MSGCVVLSCPAELSHNNLEKFSSHIAFYCSCFTCTTIGYSLQALILNILWTVLGIVPHSLTGWSSNLLIHPSQMLANVRKGTNCTCTQQPASGHQEVPMVGTLVLVELCGQTPKTFVRYYSIWANLSSTNYPPPC